MEKEPGKILTVHRCPHSSDPQKVGCTTVAGAPDPNLAEGGRNHTVCVCDTDLRNSRANLIL